MVGQSNKDVKVHGYHSARCGTLTRDQNPNLAGTPHHLLWDAAWVRGDARKTATADVHGEYVAYDVEDEECLNTRETV
jgi:hypothetical protein